MKKLRPVPYVKQSMLNLSGTLVTECIVFRDRLLDYKFAKDDIHFLENQTYRTVSKIQGSIKRTIRENPDKFHFIVYLTSGHGMNVEGL